MFKFEVVAKDKKARVGKITTPHGEIMTPVFTPVATQGTVKALDSRDVREVGDVGEVGGTKVQLILANTYHLYLRPGAETIAKLGGLHKFMDWDGPILTDSGGFQVFSLGFGVEHEVGKIVSLYGEKLKIGEVGDVGEVGGALIPRTKLCKVEEEGPTFQSHIDGSTHFFSPEKSVETQVKMGADFIVALDECTSPLHNYEYTKISMERTHRWERRSLEKFEKLEKLGKQQMYGVVQGGPFEDLRIESAKFVSKNDFFGIGIGGALVSREKMHEILDWIYPHLAPEKPRHLLGIGTVDDIFEAVERGVDQFDCVYPTRIARAGFLLGGVRDMGDVWDVYNKERFGFDITKSIFHDDLKPIDKNCSCYTCRTFSRAYLHHLFKAHELLAYRLATIHNIYFMMKLMAEIREAISEKRFERLKEEWLEK